ncbi:PAS domain S-box protein, partial [candidate division KSB1 bacterium]|nr:PAS domain S-box protein [candidate division KSB1 bacterium]
MLNTPLDGMELIFKSPIPVCIVDKDGKIHLANEGFNQLAGTQGGKKDKALKNINSYIEIDLKGLFSETAESFCGYSSKILASSDVLQISGGRIQQGELFVLYFCIPFRSHCDREKEMQVGRDFFRILRSFSLPLMIYSTNTIFCLNDAAEDLLGYSRIYEPSPIPKDFLRSRINKKLYENAQARLNGENLPNTYDTEMITKTGSKKYIRISVQLVTYRGSQALLATFLDLTDKIKLQKQLVKARKNLKVKIEKRTQQLQLWNEKLEKEIHKRRRADSALKESEEKYRKLVEMANEIITTIDRDGKITFINQYGADRLGLKVTETVGRSLFDIFSPYYAGKHVHVIQSVIDEGQNVQYENVSELQGKEYWFNTTIQPIEKGNSNEALLIIYDITEMKNQQTELENYRRHLEELVKARTEELSRINLKLQNEINEKNRIQAELIERREKYRFLVEHQLEVVARIDMNGRFNYTSPSCSKLLGKSEKELLGAEFWRFVHEDDLKQGIEVWQQLR